MNFTYYSGVCSIPDPWSNIDFLHSLVVSSPGHLFSLLHTFYQNLTKKHSNLSKSSLVTHLIPSSFYWENKQNLQHSCKIRIYSAHQKRLAMYPLCIWFPNSPPSSSLFISKKVLCGHVYVFVLVYKHIGSTVNPKRCIIN